MIETEPAWETETANRVPSRVTANAAEENMTPTIELEKRTTTAKVESIKEERRVLLVVDDEVGPRQSLHMVFKDEYEVVLAEDGEQALSLARDRHIDAAVLDIRMPGMNGVEVLAKLREIDSSIQVVMLTAYETIDTARQALRLGACDYLTKPFDLATMRTSVATAMVRRALADAMQSNTHRLQELQEALRAQQLQAEIAKTKNDIYASVVHDINGPLTIIAGFVEIINQHMTGTTHLEGENLELIKDRLNRISRQVNNASEISQRYLDFLRKKPLQKIAVATRTILNDLGELLKFHPNSHRNKLSILPLQEDVVAEIDGTELIQLLLNLAINALQATNAPHEVEIHGHCLSQPLDLHLMVDTPESRFINREHFHNQAPLLAITVRDNGPGIPAEILPFIFEPGFTTKPERKGTGLGLVIVQRFVIANRGGLHVQTHLGSGTTFTVYLPGKTMGNIPAEPAP
jgi:two-component system, sensor histidine kinase and response regulator